MNEDYQKSPVKSSPSFPEDADEEDEQRPCASSSPINDMGPPNLRIPEVNSVPQTLSGRTSVANDDYDDVDLDSNSKCNEDISFMDSTMNFADTSDKKVHWTNVNIQILLDRVEAHLEEFTIHKKHKSVWQQIGLEMEPLGFSAEHCYNKWKNLRRDVRLLVNNPTKLVRNGDILRRVARLILIIYPNVDASTMQVTSERPSKSSPTTPSGKMSTMSNNSQNIAPESPVGAPVMMAPAGFGSFRPQSPNFYSSRGSTNGPSTPKQANLAPPSSPFIANFNINPTNNNNNTANNPTFGAVPTTMSMTSPLTSNINVQNMRGSPNMKFNMDTGEPQAKANDINGNCYMLNSAALLMQSGLLNDLIKQPKQEDDRTHSPLMNGGPGGGTSSVNSDVSQNSNVASLASSILSNLCSSGNTNSLLSTLVESLSGGHNSPCSPAPAQPTSQLLVDRAQLSGELSLIVERLRDEEAVHLRLTEMVAHLADELRAAGQRRQAALDQLIGLVKSGVLSGNTMINNTPISASSLLPTSALTPAFS